MHLMKITLAISDKAIAQGKLLAGAKGTSFSKLVEDLIIRNFNVDEITKAAKTACDPVKELAKSFGKTPVSLINQQTNTDNSGKPKLY